MTSRSSRPSRCVPALAAALLFAAGCAPRITQTHYTGSTFLDTNHISFQHAFDERTEAEVRSRAQEQCRQLKRLALQTSRSCSLDRCTTSYQCIPPEDAGKYQGIRGK